MIATTCAHSSNPVEERQYGNIPAGGTVTGNRLVKMNHRQEMYWYINPNLDHHFSFFALKETLFCCQGGCSTVVYCIAFFIRK